MSGFGGIGYIIYQPIYWSFPDKGLYNSNKLTVTTEDATDTVHYKVSIVVG